MCYNISLYMVIKGEYKNGLRDGKGVYNYSGGEKYDGMFANGLRDGKGVFTWKNGLNWPGFNIDDNQFPTEMLVDYIRVYKN